MKVTSILIVATNKYYSYFLRLLPEILTFIDEGSFLQIIVMTDVQSLPRRTDRYELLPVTIKGENWPHSTTNRYQYFLQHKNLIKGENIIWIDADMRIVEKFSSEALLHNYDGLLSIHPGFTSKVSNYRKPNQLLHRSILKYLHNQAILYFGNSGWEKNRKSQAFVPIIKRKKYYQGGFWIAKKSTALLLCEDIANQAKTDLQRIGRYANHNDESYINKIAAKGRMKLSNLPYGFVSAKNYYWSLTPNTKVICLEKKDLNLFCGFDSHL